MKTEAKRATEGLVLQYGVIVAVSPLDRVFREG